jgi:hypothetical protein
MNQKPLKPYPSWVWDNTLNAWTAPNPLPDNVWIYLWNENDVSWVSGGCKLSSPNKQVYTP